MNEFDRNPGMVPPVPPDDPPSDSAKPVSIHHGMVVRLRNYFLTGLVLVGPVVGASVFAVLQDTVMRQTEFWRALLGAIILTLVLTFPLGLVGSLARLLGNRKAQP